MCRDAYNGGEFARKKWTPISIDKWRCVWVCFFTYTFTGGEHQIIKKGAPSPSLLLIPLIMGSFTIIGLKWLEGRAHYWLYYTIANTVQVLEHRDRESSRAAVVGTEVSFINWLMYCALCHLYINSHLCWTPFFQCLSYLLFYPASFPIGFVSTIAGEVDAQRTTFSIWPLNDLSRARLTRARAHLSHSLSPAPSLSLSLSW